MNLATNMPARTTGAGSSAGTGGGQAILSAAAAHQAFFQGPAQQTQQTQQQQQSQNQSLPGKQSNSFKYVLKRLTRKKVSIEFHNLLV